MVASVRMYAYISTLHISCVAKSGFHTTIFCPIIVVVQQNFHRIVIQRNFLHFEIQCEKIQYGNILMNGSSYFIFWQMKLQAVHSELNTQNIVELNVIVQD